MSLRVCKEVGKKSFPILPPFLPGVAKEQKRCCGHNLVLFTKYFVCTSYRELDAVGTNRGRRRNGLKPPGVYILGGEINYTDGQSNEK